jgi:uncharacterized protein DUF3750
MMFRKHECRGCMDALDAYMDVGGRVMQEQLPSDLLQHLLYLKIEISGMKKISKVVCIIFLLLLVGPLSMAFNDSIKFGQNWRIADRNSTGIAPDPTENKEAIIQVYSARAFNWRALFAVHTWITIKEKNAEAFTVHHVVGWRSWRNLPVVVSEEDIPDRSWYGHKPVVIRDIRGPEAEPIIAKINQAIASYPYPEKYVMWPGPNSNTFIAYIGRNVPELRLDLPPTAIGKDFLTNYQLFAKTPSGTGFQFSLFGTLGFLISAQEGIEINILTLGIGLNPVDLELRLPGIGIIR